MLRARELPPREQAELAAALRAVLPEGCVLITAGVPLGKPGTTNSLRIETLA